MGSSGHKSCLTNHMGVSCNPHGARVSARRFTHCSTEIAVMSLALAACFVSCVLPHWFLQVLPDASEGSLTSRKGCLRNHSAPITSAVLHTAHPRLVRCLELSVRILCLIFRALWLPRCVVPNGPGRSHTNCKGCSANYSGLRYLCACACCSPIGCRWKS